MKKKKKIQNKDKRYDFTRTDADEKQDIKEEVGKIDDKVDRVLDLKKLDEDNPMERAIKFDYLKKNPPTPGYMKVSMHEAFTKEGEGFVISESEQKEGILRLVHDPYRIVDLNTSIMADVTRCPSHVIPQLIDEFVQINMQEKHEFKPEKVKEEFKWWWLIILLMMLPGIILIVLMFIK